MARRFPTAERRDQIVLATLALLERQPVGAITTRAIADEVGISQPALFRHFDSREALLAAVVAYSRGVLRDEAEAAFATGGGWSATADALASVVMEHVAAYPGLPRLLFYDLSARGDSPAHASLAGLVAMQAGLVAELVRSGQRAGDVPPQVDAEAAGRLFVAGLQGAIAQWLGQAELDPGLARSMVRMWVAAVRAGEPAAEARVAGVSRDGACAGTGEAGAEAAEPGDSVPGEALVALDVRPLLARGEEPLDAILEALGRVADDGLLLLTAPFRPSPLLALLEGRGHGVDVEQQGANHWEIEVRGVRCPTPIEARDLEAPEPMEAVLLATGALQPGGVVVARLPRMPRLLLPHLEQRGLDWVGRERADGTAVLHVRRPR